MWRKINLAIMALTCLTLLSCSQKKEATMKLNQIFDSYWEFRLKSDPTFATYLGDHRYDDKLPDYSETAYLADLDTLKNYLAQSEKINPQDLSETDRVSLLIFQKIIRDGLEGAKFKSYVFPISQQNGPQVDFPQLISYHPFKTQPDYQNYVTRLNAFPKQIDDIIANMQKGLAEGLLPAQVNIEKAVPQIKAQIVAKPEFCELYQPVKNFPANFSKEVKDNLTQQVSDAISNSIVPSFKKLLAFVQTQYLPKCRKEVGIWSLPDGKERYEFYARIHTTTNLTPQEIFDIGKKQLALIQQDMNKIKEEVGFKGTLQQFMQSMRTNPKFFYSSKDSLMNGFRQILIKMDAKLPELFGRLPKAKWDLKEIEAYRADAAPDAYYYSAPEDFSRPGYFYVNTSHLNMRPKYTMEALAYHEAVPGHHLQGSIQQELQDLPKFRKHEWFTAFGEGWALYSEGLPKEVGFYSDPYSDFGRLTFQAWRATRLIVDTGIHYFKWSRQQAIDFFKQNTGLSEHNINSEVDRYIAWPGQALAYKIGQLKIKELRERAEAELGERFDVKAFHDQVLGEGCLPLDVLEEHITRWIGEVKNSKV